MSLITQLFGKSNVGKCVYIRNAFYIGMGEVTHMANIIEEFGFETQ